ncbi:MAG: hypothetical protein ACLFWF_07965 [Alphaproteobacteria bacterium]
MSHQAIRDAIKAKMLTVPNIGVVHTYQRYAEFEDKFKSFYVTGEALLGWHIRRVRRQELAHTATFTAVIEQWRITGYMALDDAGASELAFDTLIDNLAAAFRNDETLGGAVDSTFVDGQAGLQLDTSEPVMFAGVLCHAARGSLATRTTEEFSGTLDTFETANIKTDMEPQDGTIDSEDEVHPEQ